MGLLAYYYAEQASMQSQPCVKANNLAEKHILIGHSLENPTGTLDFYLLRVSEAVLEVEEFLSAHEVS